jgi:hypothetical protein
MQGKSGTREILADYGFPSVQITCFGYEILLHQLFIVIEQSAYDPRILRIAYQPQISVERI